MLSPTLPGPGDHPNCDASAAVAGELACLADPPPPKMPRWSAAPVGPVEATVCVPGSKSLTNRAVLVAALARGGSRLSNALVADDTAAMLTALRALGIAWRIDPATRTLIVTGSDGRLRQPDPNQRLHLNLGNAGTAMRFLSAAVTAGLVCDAPRSAVVLDGNPRMRQRPIGQLVEALASLGGAVSSTDGYPPVTIHAAGLRGGAVAFRDLRSSQFLSAVLMAAPLADGPITITVSGPLISEPYVAMTVALMADFGVPVTLRPDGFALAPATYHATEYAIEPDASSASYPLAVAAITGGRVVVPGLGCNSRQGDARFVDWLGHMGCQVEQTATATQVIGRRPLRGIQADLTAMPDMAQTLAVVALLADSPSTLTGLATLRIKETDRIAALQRELTKLGATVTTPDDQSLRIIPPTTLRPARIDTYDDHRMAMSFAVLAAVMEGLEIADPACVTKSYPGYFAMLDALLQTRRP